MKYSGVFSVNKWSKNYDLRDLQQNFCVFLFRNTIDRRQPDYVLRQIFSKFVFSKISMFIYDLYLIYGV